MFLENSLQKIHDIRKLFWIAFSFLILAFTASAQVDPTFKPVPSSPAQFTGSHTIQPDGKIIVFGSFEIVQGVQKSGIARINEDGSLDNSFDCTICDFSIGSVVVQTDGKIIIAGTKPDGPGGGNRLRRLNADGSADATFVSPFSENPDAFSPRSYVWAIQPDGKMYVSQHFTFMGDPWSYLYRLNSNGSVDSSFARLLFSYGMGQFGQKHLLGNLKLLPDGKLLIGGKHDYGFLFRVNPDGTKDNSFVSPVLTSIFTNPTLYIGSFDIQTDGKIPLLGNFNAINSVSKAGMARLNADQSVETSYTFPLALGGTATVVQKLKLLADDKLLISGPFPGKLIRLNPDASIDPTFNAPTNMTELSSWQMDAAGRILVTATFSGEGRRLARLNADGSLDTTFNVLFGTGNEVHGSVVLPDGKILFTGYFSYVNGVVRQTAARLNPDGTLDTSFDAGTGFGGRVFKLVPQADGKIIAVGEFSTVNGTLRNRFARINADGSLDTAFNPSFTGGDIVAAAVQPDGKILIGGAFSTVNGMTRTSLARLNADGSLDESFNPVLQDSPPVIRAILVQPDGKIMIAGSFTGVNGVARSKLARLNPNGSLDESFNLGSVSGGSFYFIARQANGKYIAADRQNIFRRNPDGSADFSFQPVSLTVDLGITALVLQPDGSLVIGGTFSYVNNTPRTNIAKINPNGTLDPTFLPQGADSMVWTLARQTDNKVIVGGEFSYLGGVSRLGIARVNYTVAPLGNALFDYDGDGRADVSVFRAVENKWFILRSADLGITQTIFAVAGDIPVPADYDGDGKTDLAIFRPSSGDWWYLSSINNAQITVNFGQTGDIPKPSDFDGDGKTDYVVYRPSNNAWYRLGSTGATSLLVFGTSGDQPLIGDFDGDGKTEPAIFRPSTGDWWWQSSVDNIQRAVHWGAAGDIPVPGDYDGDGKTDFVVFRPSDGGWYILYSTGSYTIATFGTVGDKPIAADYDGDGKIDIAVWRPSTGTWYLLQTTSGFGAVNFGVATDVPTENAFLP